VQRELGIGRAQFYREHARAVEALVSLLWEQRAGEDVARPSEPSADQRQPGRPRGRLALPPPRPLTSFHGREQEMDALLALLDADAPGQTRRGCSSSSSRWSPRACCARSRGTTTRSASAC
jgi:hypothetical protein